MHTLTEIRGAVRNSIPKNRIKRGIVVNKRVISLCAALCILLVACGTNNAVPSENGGNDAAEEMTFEGIRPAPQSASAEAEDKETEADFFLIGDRVRITKTYLVPEGNWQEGRTLRVVFRNYEAGEILPDLLGTDEMPREGLEVREYADGRQDCLYYGPLGQAAGGEIGELTFSGSLHYATDRWRKCVQAWYDQVGDYKKQLAGEVPQNEAFDFASPEEAAEAARQALIRCAGVEDADLASEYALNYRELEKIAGYQIHTDPAPLEAYGYQWTAEDNVYWMQFRIRMAGLPVLDHAIARDDGNAYAVPITAGAGVDAAGVAYLDGPLHMEIESGTETQLLPAEEIYAAIAERYENVRRSVTIDRIELIYIPVFDAAAGSCLLVPAWECTDRAGSLTQYFYINAADGNEMFA